MDVPSSAIRWGGAGLFAAACALPTTAEFASGGARANGADGGVDASATSTTPPPSEAGVDPRTDAGQDAGGTVLEGCPAAFVFCDAFESNPFQLKWDDQIEERGGSIRGTTGRVGQGVFADVPKRGAGTDTHAFLQTNLGVKDRRPLTVSVDIKVSANAGLGVVDIDFLRYFDPAYRISVRFADYSTGFLLREYGNPTAGHDAVGGEYPLARNLVPGTWTRLQLSVAPADGGTMKAVLSIDGEVAYSGPIKAYDYAATSAYGVAGIASTEKAGDGLSVTVDRFVVTSP